MDAGEQQASHVEVPPVVVLRALYALVDAVQRVFPFLHVALQQAREVVHSGCGVRCLLAHYPLADLEILPSLISLSRLLLGSLRVDHDLEAIQGEAEVRL